MFSPSSNPGNTFKHASGDGESVPSSTARYPMPMPQPFRHGTIVYGQPADHPGYHPVFQPTYGTWKNSGTDEESPGADLRAEEKAQFNPLGRQSESVTEKSSQHGPNPSPVQYFASPLPLESDLGSQQTDLSSNPQNAGAGETQVQGVEVRELNAEDIKPNVYHFSHLANAVQELETCKTIFGQCDEKLVNELCGFRF